MGYKSVDVGLKILIQKFSQGKGSDPNDDVLIMCGSKFTKIKPIFHMIHNTTTTSPCENNSCFLKYCFLCNKTLRLDKEVYMYKGDQGFCSVECRNRQIYLDEIKEIESETKKILLSFRRRGDGGGRCSETMALLEDYQQRHRKPLAYSKNQPIIFTFS